MFKTLSQAFVLGFMSLAAISPSQAQQAKPGGNAADSLTLNELLERVQQGRVRDNSEFSRRERNFTQNRDRQSQILRQTQAEIAREEARSERLEKNFNDNELKLGELEALLNERLGAYGELFGTVRQVAGETRAQIDESLISGELTGRTQALAKLAQTKGIPAIKQLEHLWFALQQEMTAQGEVKRFEGSVINLAGETRQAEIIRIGPFSAMSDGQFIRYVSGKAAYADLGRQPPARFRSVADDLADADAGEIVAGVVDPSRGALLNLFLQLPTLLERINQGGLVGYIIIALGLVGIVLAIERILGLSLTARKVRAQLRAGEASAPSPLGRVWAAYQANQSADVDTLELKLDDAILKEMPPLERGLGMLKLLSGVAPLLGLLGTVTGMILTFQAITLFGTGDPKLMAGGISQALMTTVLGLVVAIPILLLHAVAATRSREIVQILEEQAAGLIAAHAEKR